MLQVLKFTFNPFQENTYLLFTSDGECAIIDPGCYDKREEDLLKKTIEEEGLNPTLLLNTHCHIDHVFGNEFVHRTYGLDPMIHKKEEMVLASVSRVAEMYGLNYTPSPKPKFIEGNEIVLGEERLKILFVPGHSPGHIAFYSKVHTLLLSGDVLFKQSIGRTDLPGGSMDVLMQSIAEKLLPLPEETKVYAGHMEDTTIGEEKRLNPFLRGI
ncbi:MBL fold metallo-hydrolase [Cryomorphaceae bacterium 1068]|nr:MBL fold metallo-hydrolase [Cryomorphaceae bacterium 1068]